MSKGAKKTGGKRKRAQVTPTRKRKVRKPKRTILIVVEGEQTEKNYFFGLSRRREVRAHFSIRVKVSGGGTPSDIVQYEIDHRDERYDEVWCVLDVEGRNRRKLAAEAVELAENSDIALCLSNPCFEVWLLSHFERKAGAFTKCDRVIDQLNKQWMKNWNQRYRKNDGGLYERVSDLTETAIGNARWVREQHHGLEKNTADCNSSTDVYKLVEYLISPPENGS